jgi:hypothetical protein
MWLDILWILFAIGVMLAAILPTVLSSSANRMNQLKLGHDRVNESMALKNDSLQNFDDTPILGRIKNLLQKLEIEHVVVWGHPLHSHTHSYVHEAFVHAAKHVGINTVWVPQKTFDAPDKDKGTLLNICPKDRVLFITEGQVVDDIPQSATSWYIFHNVTDRTDLSGIPKNRILSLQFYTHSCETLAEPFFDRYHRLSIKDRMVYMPWATNLMPLDFWPLVDPTESKKKNVCVIGQHGPAYQEKIDLFMRGTKLPLTHTVAGVSNQDMMKQIREAYCAPSIIQQWQKENGYIPCRSLKNVSYGQILVTNSSESDYMLHHNTIYEADETKLAQTMEAWLQDRDKTAWQSRQVKAYQLVRSRHTYLNRLEFLLASLMTCRDSEVKSDTKSMVHLSCHTGCIAYLKYVAQQLQLDLEHINLLAENNASVYNMTSERATEYWQKYKARIMTKDCVIISDTAPLARMVLEHMEEYRGKVIVWVCNRFNYAHVDANNVNQFPDAGWYDLMKTVGQRFGDRVRIVSYTKIERAYALDQGVMWEGPFADAVLRPVGNMIRAVTQSGLPESVLQNKSNTLFIPPYLNDEKLIDYNFLEQQHIAYYRGRYNGPDDLVGFKAILHIPYAASNLALFENLLRGLVYYIPSLPFFQQLLKKHSWFSGGVDRIYMSEWYDRKNVDLFVYFDSWDDLQQKLQNREHEKKQALVQKWAQEESQHVLSHWNVLLNQWW